MRQDVSGEIVFSPDTIALLNRMRAQLVSLRAMVRAEIKQAIDRDIGELNELHDAIAAQMEANET